MIFLLFLMLFALITLKYARHHTFNIYVKKKLNLTHLNKITFLFFFFVSIVIVALNLTDFKFSIINLLSAEVYERRMVARYMERGIFTNYIISIGRSLLTIFGIYLTFVKRKPIYGIFVILFSLAVFSYDGTKTALLYPLFLTAIYLIYSHSKYIIFLPSLLGIIVVLSFLEFNILETNILSELLIRRIISVPGFLNTVYWDFFSEHSKVLLTDSIGKYFFDQVYEIPTTFIIGLEYFNNVETNANTGIWMGGFAHFGVIGIFMVSIIAGFLLGFIDNLTQKNYFMLGTLVCAYIGMNWSEQMLHTSMLTGGVFYILLFLIFLQHSNLIDVEEFSSNKIKKIDR
jgi:oligosaccharide repeat unit polymerase